MTTVTVAADAAIQALATNAARTEKGAALRQGARGVALPRHTELLVAAAKAEASVLAIEIAKAGHQLHGAIGSTEEHSLGRYTKRLWSWRQEYGNELYWQRRIASLIDGADGHLWPLVSDTVPMEAPQT